MKIKFLTKFKVPVIPNIEHNSLMGNIFSIQKPPGFLKIKKPTLPTFVAGARVKEEFLLSNCEGEMTRFIVVLN